MRRLHWKWFLASVAVSMAGQLVRGEVIINVYQNGSNVMTSASGSLDVTALSLFASSVDSSPGEVTGNSADVELAPTSSGLGDLYTGAVGTQSFGSGFAFLASSGIGDVVGIEGSYPSFVSGGFVRVPAGYVSGTKLSATGIYDNETISSLGLNVGTYTYTWGSTANHDNDSVVVDIGTAPAPAPSAFAGGSVGLALLAGWAWRQRRRGASAL
ncbi:MAG TPA: hypothetical protein VGG19_20725 [Tepidisphaeraceae bacterium]